MQMAGPDIVLFVVGALLFGSASYAIVQDGGFGTSTSALGVFDVSFPTTTTEVGEETVASFRSTTADFDVTQMNVTQAVVTLNCQDTAGAAVPFTLQVQVTGPGGLAADPVSGTCGDSLVVDVPVADAPEPTSVQGSTEDEARENLGEYETAHLAMGTWTVDVSGGRAADPPVPVGDPGGSIVFEVVQWTPAFAPVQR